MRWLGAGSPDSPVSITWNEYYEKKNSDTGELFNYVCITNLKFSSYLLKELLKLYDLSSNYGFKKL